MPLSTLHSKTGVTPHRELFLSRGFSVASLLSSAFENIESKVQKAYSKSR